MPSPPDLSADVVRLLAERAGQRCSNPTCGRSTSGPSDDGSGDSTTLGKACHLTAARPLGPRYGPLLSDAQRAHPDNGIWMCAICADQIDKKENEAAFPVALLRMWKEFHESVTGTDHASVKNRRLYPLRQLTIQDFAGIRGEATITFVALTLVLGTMKLSHTMSELLCIFGDRQQFERTCQPRDGSSSVYARVPITDESDWVITVNHPLRTFTKRGALKLLRSDGQEFVINIENSGAMLLVDDAPVPVFAPVINAINPGKLSISYSDQENRHVEKKLASHLGISVAELKACINGVPADVSVFGYDYSFEDSLKLRQRSEPEFQTVASLSGGEQSRLLLDLAVKISTFRARLESVVLLVDQAKIFMDPQGWACFLEWVENRKPPFQTIVDLHMAPLRGSLNHALCYEVRGRDMDVSGFAPKIWNSFKRNP